MTSRKPIARICYVIIGKIEWRQLFTSCTQGFRWFGVYWTNISSEKIDGLRRKRRKNGEIKTYKRERDDGFESWHFVRVVARRTSKFVVSSSWVFSIDRPFII